MGHEIMDEIPETQPDDDVVEEPCEKDDTQVEPADTQVEPADTQVEPADTQVEPATTDANDERKREMHRQSSRAWHSKWISKGVPRAAIPPEPESEGAPSCTSSSLARAREKFITEWIEASDMPKSQERFKAACKAWMESTTRADFMSARAGVQR